jgi:hypothetical protein
MPYSFMVPLEKFIPPSHDLFLACLDIIMGKRLFLLGNATARFIILDFAGDSP